MKKFSLSALTLLVVVGFSGCSVTPHVNRLDNTAVQVNVDSKDIDFSKEMKKATICKDPNSLDGDLTIMAAAKKAGIQTVKYSTYEDHFTTEFSLLSLFRYVPPKYTEKCITVYGE